MSELGKLALHEVIANLVRVMISIISITNIGLCLSAYNRHAKPLT